MAFDSSGGYVAASNLQDASETAPPIFTVERVELRFGTSSEFLAAEVANNVLILALSTNRILRIDLDSPTDIDDIDLPKKASEIGVIRRMFLDPSASHLIITTTLSENYYLHTQSRQPKTLSRLKGVSIESIAWNPSRPTASTREILVGASDGNVYETYIDPSTEFYRREEKYFKSVHRADGAVTGLWADLIPNRSDARRVLVATPGKLFHFVGKIGRHGHEGSGSIFAALFESESPTVHELATQAATGTSCLAVSPDPTEGAHADSAGIERTFAWLSSQGVFHGPLLTSSDLSRLGNKLYSESRMLPRAQIPATHTAGGRLRHTQDPVTSMILSQWHIIQLVEGRVVATNRLDDTIVYDQMVLEAGQSAVGLAADLTKNTYWLFTAQEIFEIAVRDEDRDVWKIMLKNQQFDAASRHAKTSAQKDAVATASGDFLVSKGQFLEAANVYGRSTKPFEQVALTFIDHGEQDALRRYLLTKLSTLKKSSVMQRIMVATWLIEIYMSKLNSLDDTITTRAELSDMNATDSQMQLAAIRKEYQGFVTKYKSDLDRKTTYEIISSHGREEELLYYATVIEDYNYVLAYWIQRERWAESLTVLNKQTNPDTFYKYSSVLMAAVPIELVEIMMRQTNLDARKLIPALLNYNKNVKGPLTKNQAVRYLLFEINQHNSTDAAVHNTLISIYASHPSKDESALLSYLQAQSYAQVQYYDADFALRLCIQHARVQSCVHIYSSMSQYSRAVDLALKHNAIDLASSVADRSETPPVLRKKLWLAVAKKVIRDTDGIKGAIEFLKRCDLLRIEDLIPFFPDFVLIDDFKDEICAALESYSSSIDELKQEMDASADTAAHIKRDIKALDQRYAIVEPGERCYVCRLPLLARQFFVFPCQHAFHSDCLGRSVVEMAGQSRGRRIRELQAEVSRLGNKGKERERVIRELDSLVAGACEMAVDQVDEPFVKVSDNTAEWAL
ncbi:hypothetical protein M501DRAFT_928930 [Patellaria atrata CBS 101060]|uniref:Pep3/Vps18/deep orange domain-containing protein n=1 Tax=Patellaria atrata CBS 101060 TaxID=1346257 RepID=A0A9P4VTJ2_9PEZI|nr:hypothetical protein M501DRAFT_928930 [Patellaria atrata CBS 101060]